MQEKMMLPVMLKRGGLTRLHWMFLTQGNCHLYGLMFWLFTVTLIQRRPSELRGWSGLSFM